jgi:hypothetical protein
MKLILCLSNCCYIVYLIFSLFLCWEIITQTYVVIVAVKSMFATACSAPYIVQIFRNQSKVISLDILDVYGFILSH